jgi:hypothetical protein
VPEVVDMKANLPALNRGLFVFLVIIICLITPGCRTRSITSTPATSQITTSLATTSTIFSTAPATTAYTTMQDDTTSLNATTSVTTTSVLTPGTTSTTAAATATTTVTTTVTTTSATPSSTTSTTQPASTTSTTIPTTTTSASAFLPPIKVAAPPPPGQAFSAEEQTAINTAIIQLKNVIANFLKNLKADAPRNPGLTTQYNAKIALLENPALYDNIVNSKHFLIDFAISSNAKRIPIVATFPLPELRDEAWYALQLVKLSLAVLEDFYAVPYAQVRIDVWYGFAVGSSGGWCPQSGGQNYLQCTLEGSHAFL